MASFICNLSCSFTSLFTPKGCFKSKETAKIEEGVRLFFLLEEHHGDKEDLKRNIAFIKNNYICQRGDTILIEDDEALPWQDLNLKQIAGLAFEEYRIAGWDPHKSCQERAAVNSALSSLQEASDKLEKGVAEQEDLTHLLTVARQVHLKALGILKDIPLQDFLQKKEFSNERKFFAKSCKTYAEGARSVVCAKHFSRRQENLAKKIKEFFASTPEGCLFVLAGKNHVDEEKNPCAPILKAFFLSLEEIPFQVIKPVIVS